MCQNWLTDCEDTIMVELKYGDAGCLYIPDINILIPLYDKSGLSQKQSQALVDRADSAVLCRRYGGGHCDYIADHAAQGFEVIKKCNLFTVAVIQTPDAAQCYQCVAVMPGTNTGSNLLTCTGQSLKKVKWADLCLYTCNDATGKNITMVFFKKSIRYPYPIYPAREVK